MLKKEFLRLLASFVYFSRIPVPLSNKINAEHYKKSVRYLPWVGFIVSVAGAIVMYVATPFLPKHISTLLGLLTTILLTGALHEDGLADVCDGFGGGYQKQKILDIMKDSRIGTYGVIGLLIAFMFRFTALNEMPIYFKAVFFIAAHTLSRYTLIVIMFKYTYARDENSSKAKTVIGDISIMDLFIGFIPVVISLILTGTFWVISFIIPVWITQWIMGRYYYKKIEGYTGDCLGALQQITEIVFYIFTLIWLKFTW